MFIRRATEGDVDVLAQVHLQTVTFAYAGLFPEWAAPPSIADSIADWKRAVADPAHSALVAELDGEIVGTVASRPEPDADDYGQLRRLHVLPAHWGRGIGTELHDAAVGILASQFTHASLWVLEGNLRARAMYERQGWKLVRDRVLEWPGLGVIEVRYERELHAAE